MAASVKVDTDFEGLIHAKAFSQTVKSLKHDLVQLNATGDGLTIRSGGFTETLQRHEEDHEGYFDLHMWDEGTKWEDCPGKLIEGIALVEPLFSVKKKASSGRPPHP